MRNVFRLTIFQVPYAMCSVSIFSCIVTISSSFMIFFIFQIFLFYKYKRFLGFHMISALLLLIISFFKKIIFITCSLKYSQNILPLPMYTSCLFSMLLNEDIADIEKPDGICLLAFVVDEFSELFLHPSIFSITYSRSA